MRKQEPGETLRSYVKRFFNTRATIANVSDEDVIDYFHDGLTTQSMVKLDDMMQHWADVEEQECSRFPHRNDDKNYWVF